MHFKKEKLHWICYLVIELKVIDKIWIIFLFGWLKSFIKNMLLDFVWVLSRVSWRLLSHNVNEMEVLIIVLLARWDNCRCWNRWLCNFLCEHGPFIVLFTEVLQPIFWNSVGYANVNSIWWKDTVHFVEHGFTIGSRIVTTENGVETSFVDHCIKYSILTLKTSCIHLLIRKLRNFFFVILLHLFDDGEWNVNICYVLVSVFKHVFGHFGVATTKH